MLSLPACAFVGCTRSKHLDEEQPVVEASSTGVQVPEIRVWFRGSDSSDGGTRAFGGNGSRWQCAVSPQFGNGMARRSCSVISRGPSRFIAQSSVSASRSNRVPSFLTSIYRKSANLARPSRYKVPRAQLTTTPPLPTASLVLYRVLRPSRTTHPSKWSKSLSQVLPVRVP